MLNEKRIYIIVSDYPYGNGEPFLEDELHALAKKFDKISLIITSNGQFNNSSYKFPVPENMELMFYFQNDSLITRLKALWFMLNHSHIKNEIQIIRKNYQLKISFTILRILYSYVVHGLNFRNYAEKIINSDNAHKASYYFYSYWCTQHTYGLALLKTKYPNLRTFTRIHRWDLYLNVHNPPYLPFRKYITDKIDKIFSVSEDGKNYLLKTIPHIPEQKIKVNFLGTTINRKPSGEIKRNKLIVLSLAFISKVKRVDLLAESIALIDNFDIEWHHIGGGSHEATEVENYAANILSSKANVTYSFHGNLSKKQIYDFLTNNTVHVLVNTSWSEGLPVSIMEAMSYGIPVIATDAGGNREIVKHNFNGILLPQHPEKEEVANAIKTIHSLSDADYKTYCDNAYHTWNTKFNNEKNNHLFISELLKTDDELYKVCNNCIHDNIDYPEITFDENGVCNMCRSYIEISSKQILSNTQKTKALKKLIDKIKSEGTNKEYDCIVGLSGGVDSCFVAYKAKEFGLRPLIVHLDNGWNSELAVKNIENIVRKLGFDLYTHVINWNEFRDLQLSYFKASVVDIEALTDHAISAILYRMADKYNVKYILSGENIVTEGRLPPSWVHLKNDLINIKAIHKKFGNIPIKTFPTLGAIRLSYYKNIRKIKYIPLLDYLDYNKQKAKEIITKELEWRDYGGKHYESLFTRFYQSYILPVKFHIDKRKSHYSTLVCSEQLTRGEALELMKLPIYDKDKLKEDKEYVLKKLGLTEKEFDEIMKQPIKAHTDYPSMVNYYNILMFFRRTIKKIVSLN